MDDGDDLYAALGVPEDATPEEIHRAYRRASKRAHPDAGGDPRRWALICTARDVLQDPARRRGYDRSGDQGSGGPDNSHVPAVVTVAQYMMMVLMDCRNRRLRPAEWDLAESVRDLIKKDMAAARDRKRAFAGLSGTMADLAPRFTGAARGIAGEAAALFAATCDEQIKIMGAALDLLQGCRFMADEPRESEGGAMLAALGADRAIDDMFRRMIGGR